MSKWPMNEAMAAEDRERKRLERELRKAQERAIHEQRMRDDPEYARECQKALQAVQDLTRALEAGYQSSTLGSGSALPIESLDATMSLVTFDPVHLVLIKPQAPALVGLTKKSRIPDSIRAASPFCGFCGKSVSMCTCMDGLEPQEIDDRAQVISSAPPPNAITPAPPATRYELAEKRIQKPTKPVEDSSVCYLCGYDRKRVTLLQARSTGFFICAPCSLRHLGE